MTGDARAFPGRRLAGSREGVTENPKGLAEEATTGRSERTPALALTGVTIVVGALVAVIVAAALIVYYVV